MQYQSHQQGKQVGSDTLTRRKRVSLTAHRSEIEDWVRQGFTDEWIARALGTTSNSVQSYRSRTGILRVKKQNTVQCGDVITAPAYTPGGASDPSVYEGVLEHGEEEGYGLWLDPAVADDPSFIKGFSRVSAVEVTVEKDRIVLKEAPGAASSTEEGNDFRLGPSGFDPSGESVPASDRERGRLRWFDQTKGYGFIYRPSGDQIFFHKTNTERPEDIATLDGGDAVSYEVGNNDRGLVALDVRGSS